MKKKLLLVLQYWNDDKPQAMELLNILADSVEKLNPYADLVVYPRFDCGFPKDKLMDKLREKFSVVWKLQGGEHKMGWPDACNAMWINLAMEAAKNSKEDGLWSRYKAFFSMEGDCCPLAKDWLKKIHDEWDDKNVNVLGSWHHITADRCNKVENNIGHMNGNGLFSIDIGSKIAFQEVPEGNAWDTFYALEFKTLGWHDTPLIKSDWKTNTIDRKTYDKYKESGCVFLHGIKDYSCKNFFKDDLKKK
jgi:hypothetical protein